MYIRKLRFNQNDLLKYMPTIFTNSFEAFDLPDSSENHYVMRLIWKSIQFFGTHVRPSAQPCLHAISKKLIEACKNPREPIFNQYMFESVASLLKYATEGNDALLDEMQQTLFPAFDMVINQDVQEFHPYIFQVNLNLSII